MKKIKYTIAFLIGLSVISCKKDFLQPNPQGQLTDEQLSTQDGVEGLLTGTYSMLNGNLNGTYGNYGAAPSQWIFGEVASDDAHKGSNEGDQAQISLIETHQPTSVNDHTGNMWNVYFEGIKRANKTLTFLAQVQSGSNPFATERADQIEGETKLLRAHFYFYLVRVFKNIPIITEATTTPTVPNDKDVYPTIISDLQTAVDKLPTDKPRGQIGRVDKYAAQAYLGKVYLYQKKYQEAYTLLKSVITAKPDIATLAYTDNFDITKENGTEAIFTVQHSVGADGSGGDNGNVGDILNFPYNTSLPITCCGFFQPSFDLVNAYRVDADGLPMLDGSYRTNPYKSDFGLTAEQKAAYTIDKTLAVDPRLDYTVGRRGAPYRDWGIMAGDTWIRDANYSGPFVPYKNAIEASQVASNTAPGTTNVTGLNVNIIRLADVYLMAAECDVELNNLAEALSYVNKIRTRAANLAPKTVSGSPVATYKVSNYPSFPNADYARNAVRFERRLELALEGQRFFDLVRWGTAKQTLESYAQFESNYITYLRGLTFTTTDEYFPIPQDQIDRSQGVLKQNPGY